MDLLEDYFDVEVDLEGDLGSALATGMDAGFNMQSSAATNNIMIKLRASISMEKSIHDALARQAEREAKGIQVTVDGAKVTLRGKVHSLAESESAQCAAWSAPGVGSVLNALTIT